MDGGGLEPLCGAAWAEAPGCWGRRVSVGVGVQGFATLEAFEALLYVCVCFLTKKSTGGKSERTTMKPKLQNRKRHDQQPWNHHQVQKAQEAKLKADMTTSTTLTSTKRHSTKH
jgi:Spy/CpxP family protein refolding chaperone